MRKSLVIAALLAMTVNAQAQATLGPFTAPDGTRHLYTCQGNTVEACAGVTTRAARNDGFRVGASRGNDDGAIIAGAVFGAIVIGALIFGGRPKADPIPKGP